MKKNRFSEERIVSILWAASYLGSNPFQLSLRDKEGVRFLVDKLQRADHSSFYFTLREFLHRNRWLLRTSQGMKGVLFYGPLRNLFIRYFQLFHKRKPIERISSNLFSTLDVGKIVHEINENGYSIGEKLPDEYIHEILQFCEIERRIKYWNPHRECQAIDQVCRNEKILEVAKRYLGVEPILWVTELKWSIGPSMEKGNIIPSAHQEPVQYDPYGFHYDMLDFKSLTVFIYLTDVDANAGPHVVISGTHKKKSLWDLFTIILSDQKASQKYGDRVKTILGEKGTVLFEETHNYHKVSPCKTKRLLLKIDYVLQRKSPPPRPIMS